MLFAFDGFTLDPNDRRLRRDGGAPVELNARYLDALALLVGEAGRLVSKERFLEEVWRGVPVTDEALTQCIKTLRRQLGDDVSRPRFIETVPKHGYRFVAEVARVDGESVAAAPAAARPSPWRRTMLMGGAGTLGAGGAGLLGGLFYGFAAAAQPGGTGAASVLLVLLWLTIAAAVIGGAGVSFGIAALAPRWTIAGGALGGLVVGAVAKLLGLDAFNLLLGRSPGDITGGAEGLILGASVGLGALLARRATLRRGVALAALSGAVAGFAIPWFGGRLMGGSLDLLVRGFPGSRLRLDGIGALFGESGFGPISQAATGALEGALFAGCIVGAMILARRSLGDDA
ncbi:MAG TPA: transcriptional regulator [Allosphingosinicella sp.]|nr:transcriptional regulator [Allosphingosinicella sp.]